MTFHLSWLRPSPSGEDEAKIVTEKTRIRQKESKLKVYLQHLQLEFEKYTLHSTPQLYFTLLPLCICTSLFFYWSHSRAHYTTLAQTEISQRLWNGRPYTHFLSVEDEFYWFFWSPGFSSITVGRSAFVVLSSCHVIFFTIIPPLRMICNYLMTPQLFLSQFNKVKILVSG